MDLTVEQYFIIIIIFYLFIFLIQSGYLLIISYQLAKIQAPSSNSFRDILLTSFKMPKF